MYTSQPNPYTCDLIFHDATGEATLGTRSGGDKERTVGR
jgi:hypothetical protein